MSLNVEKEQLNELLDAGLIDEAEKAQREAALNAVVSLGIDLGTTQMTLAVVQGSARPVVVPNELGQFSTPPLVSFDGKTRAIGEAAVAMTTRFPNSSVAKVKTALTHVPSSCPTLAKENEDGAFCVEFGGETCVFDVVEILVMLLTQLKRRAAAFCGIADECAWTPVTVVSLPDNVSDEAKGRVRLAAKAAGLDAVVCGDALALAYAYGQAHGVGGACNMVEAAEDADGEQRRVVVVDVGDAGATVSCFDVTQKKDTETFGLTMVAAERIDGAGGDSATGTLMAEACKTLKGATLSSKAEVRLFREAQKQKAILSTVDRATMHLECLVGDGDLRATITRSTLAPGLTAAADKVCAVLAALPKGRIHAVELVGGGSRVPVIRERVGATLGAECVQGGRTLDSSSSVAVGAAGLAHWVSGGTEDQVPALETQVVVDDAEVAARAAKEAARLAADAVVAGVYTARNGLEETLLRVLERMTDGGEYGKALKPHEAGVRALIEADQAWLDEEMAQDKGNETEERRAMYAGRLATFVEALGQLSPDYVAVEARKKAEAEKALREAEEAQAKAAHTSNIDVPRTTKQRLAAAERQKKGGTVAFKDLDYRSAAQHFVDGISLLAGCRDMSADQETEVKALQLSLYLNVALAFLKLDVPKKAIDNCTEALKIDPTNSKALFRRATGYEKQGDVDKALADIVASGSTDLPARKLKQRLEAKIAKRLANEKAMYSKMFS